jgi:hypothetical protein
LERGVSVLAIGFHAGSDRWLGVKKEPITIWLFSLLLVLGRSIRF